MRMRMCVCGRNYASLFWATLLWRFHFDSAMGNLVFGELRFDGLFELWRGAIADDMEGGIVMKAIYTPDMKMMDTFDLGHL